MSGLQVQAITVTYDQEPALRQFSLDVGEGEIIAVLGPSGSGKSTLLRAVAGLEPLVEGRIVLGGRDLAGVPTHRRGLGLMFQDHGLFAHLDVAGNIGYGLRTARASPSDQQRRIAELLALVELEGFERRGTGQLSGGEAQRVALARALAPEPGLLMLDEPLGSLDRALRDQLTADLRRMLTDIGQTALHVTHDQSEAFAVADRVAVVSEGQLMAIGSPAELWADPETVFVAEFLGHPNIWEVLIDGDGGVSWGPHDLGSVNPDHPLRQAGPGQRSVVVPTTAIRPADDRDTGVRWRSDRASSIEVYVASSTFRQGVYDVAATTGVEPDPPAQINFTTTEAVTAASSMKLLVDVEMLRPLTAS